MRARPRPGPITDDWVAWHWVESLHIPFRGAVAGSAGKRGLQVRVSRIICQSIDEARSGTRWSTGRHHASPPFPCYPPVASCSKRSHGTSPQEGTGEE